MTDEQLEEVWNKEVALGILKELSTPPTDGTVFMALCKGSHLIPNTPLWLFMAHAGDDHGYQPTLFFHGEGAGYKYTILNWFPLTEEMLACPNPL